MVNSTQNQIRKTSEKALRTKVVIYNNMLKRIEELTVIKDKDIPILRPYYFS